MNSVYFDSALSDADRRRELYAGQVFVYSPRPATLALTEWARQLIEEAFHPLVPETAQHHLPVERFVEIVAPLKPRFIHHPRTKELLLQLLADLDCEMDQTYYDVPRMRVATADHYLDAGVAYPLHPHRDTWYASPMCQLNWWLPVYPISPDSTFAFFPQYWGRAVKNTSHEYNHYEWNRVGRKDAAKEIKADTRKQPKAIEQLDLSTQVRVVCPAGGLILFSGAQLHATVANSTGRSRFSVDFRTAHGHELAVKGGARNHDCFPQGTTLRELRRASDQAPVPAEILLVHEPVPPMDEDGLVFLPTVAVDDPPRSSPSPVMERGRG